jgi:hypothetical protein
MLMPFPSLRDFLLVTDPTDKPPGRSLWNGATLGTETRFWNGTLPKLIPNPWQDHAIDFVNRYEIAKASYEKYGEAGPPIGSTVQTLVSGHGGGVGVIRVFAGVCPSDPRFFWIYRTRSRGNNEKECEYSLVHREYWWIEIRVVEET